MMPPREPAPASPRSALISFGLFVLPALAVLFAFRSSPSFGFVGDAKFLIEHNATLNTWASWWGQLTHDYFWGSSENTIPYWRPFTKLSWLVEAQIWGHERAAPFHLTGVLWHAAGAVAIGWLGRCMGVGPVLAAAAGVAYGLHPAPMEPVSLLMARSDVT
ncbi:MAG: hypothetical protein KC502_23490, partial [Myxococcales bacterium]|nr:hypothetical protein [Myxococcales bacterium]